jgi:glycosyltransferase involved in cell wall biosynthesis
MAGSNGSPIEVLVHKPDGSGGPVTLEDPKGKIEDPPLVSCLMPTRGDPKILRHSLECYLRQDYENRELVVVASDPSPQLETLLASYPEAEIRLVRVSPGLSLGELRNTSIAHARGGLICTWDDDDLYDPRRISISVRALLAGDSAAAVLLLQLLLWWPARKMAAVTAKGLWEGSMLARRHMVPIYPAVGRHEDNWVLNVIRKIYPVVLVPQPMLYCCAVTGKNTSDLSIYEKEFAKAEKVYRGQDYEALLASLAERMPIREYQSALLGSTA